MIDQLLISNRGRLHECSIRWNDMYERRRRRHPLRSRRLRGVARTLAPPDPYLSIFLGQTPHCRRQGGRRTSSRHASGIQHTTRLLPEGGPTRRARPETRGGPPRALPGATGARKLAFCFFKSFPPSLATRSLFQLVSSLAFCARIPSGTGLLSAFQESEARKKGARSWGLPPRPRPSTDARLFRLNRR